MNNSLIPSPYMEKLLQSQQFKYVEIGSFRQSRTPIARLWVDTHDEDEELYQLIITFGQSQIQTDLTRKNYYALLREMYDEQNEDALPVKKLCFVIGEVFEFQLNRAMSAIIWDIVNYKLVEFRLTDEMK